MKLLRFKKTHFELFIFYEASNYSRGLLQNYKKTLLHEHIRGKRKGEIDFAFRFFSKGKFLKVFYVIIYVWYNTVKIFKLLSIPDIYVKNFEYSFHNLFLTIP